MAQVVFPSNAGDVARIGLGAPLLLFALLAMLVVPLSPFVLDVLFTFNISLALVVILAGVYSRRPLDFAAFPTVLLLATLLRLALNIAATRVVLLNGHSGTGAAGHVIEAFGEFVIGGNYAVGLVVFAILVIINFVVVTKGAGRISEVTARFTLDAMPGKQMAIDADLNAGLIDQETAKTRRSEIAREADFYGAMDGASKFVRGDAVAGILILFINLIGGVSIGIAQHGMGFADAMHTYSLLTIGDGLVAQIPALVLSTSAAIMVTRMSTAHDMGKDILMQLFANPKALAVTGAIIGGMGLVPGMPNLVFLTLGGLCGGGAYLIAQKQQGAAEQSVKEAVVAPVPVARDLSWDDVTPIDPVGLEVGYRLIPMVDKNQGGQLLGRIKGVRKKLTQDLGFLIPAVHIRDNLDLAPNGYRVTLLGVVVGEAEIYPDRDLAINPGQVFGTVAGIDARDPTFGLEAKWIEPSLREQAQTTGYTVVDASTVIATHLSHLIQTHAHELLGREELQQLLDTLAKAAPKMVEDLVPDTVPRGVVLRVLKNLLEEGVSIRDMRTIAGTLAEHGVKSQDPAVLTAAVRVALGRSIVQNINNIGRELPVITLDPELEQLLQNSIQGTGDAAAALEPGLADRIHRTLADVVQRQEAAGEPAVLLVSAPIRTLLARFVRFSIPSLQVLSYNEIPDNKRIRVIASVGNNKTLNGVA
ncbi:MAG: flagellar biosynthesis protein FlhA [Gammaproteobacteria bacterium]|nr:MAG: flagellar biosynthesis protein FlhA [Gammaproteobacteria bacterium]TND06741.1 MAG: flagellar biosynthesis protein FlhA [Gammaproteobacteria bacterium]